jgi:hypothetical protein
LVIIVHNSYPKLTILIKKTSKFGSVIALDENQISYTMKRLIATVVLVLACCLCSMPASAQSKLDKLVGTWLMKVDMNGQEMEFTYNVQKTDEGVFAVMEMPGAPEQKLEIKEINGKLQSQLDVPEFGSVIDISYAFVDDDTVNVAVDAGGFFMESAMTRVKK